MWVLCSRRTERDALGEAVLQRYIKAWARCSELRVEDMSDGLQALWRQLAKRRERGDER